MSKFEDLTGQRFGRLTVVERTKSRVTPKGLHQTMWRCRCDCGNEIETRANALKTGNTQSCGCRKIEMLLARSTKHGGRQTEHTERLYGIWKSMVSRCRKGPRYSGRGIKVCEEWRDYANFRDWAYRTGYDETAPKGECTIDRIDNNGNYEPSNCRWVDMKTQANNTSKNRYIEYEGERRTAAQWADRIGITPDALCFRLNRGWTVEEALTYPPLKSNRHYKKNRMLLATGKGKE